MEQPEYSQFCSYLIGLASVLPGKEAPTDFTIEIWWEQLREYAFEDIKAAFAVIMREQTFFPTPSELHRRVAEAVKARQNVEINAALENRWAVIRTAIKAGTCEALDDTSADWAASCCGGWTRVYGHYMAKDWDGLKVFRDVFFSRIRADIVRQVKQLSAPDCRAELGFDGPPGRSEDRPLPRIGFGCSQTPRKLTFPGNAACGMGALKKMANRG